MKSPDGFRSRSPCGLGGCVLSMRAGLSGGTTLLAHRVCCSSQRREEEGFKNEYPIIVLLSHLTAAQHSVRRHHAHHCALVLTVYVASIPRLPPALYGALVAQRIPRKPQR